ncbi:MAG: heat-inducible transcriptional repressor HrcA [Acidaminococcales bacterium]|jgi:heat-inducible transcriptional repressor|nr:heat-inducible transcriptional repressor HrcA [Acidaminococcales bacterium]
MLNDRKRRILQLIIEEYISTAEPVGSRIISRKHELGLSSATIRNEMSDLEDMGYLEQPHTSAGRVPSALGYRLYVDYLLSPEKITEREIALIQSWLRFKAQKLDEVFRTTAKILSRISKNISIVRTREEKSCQLFKYIRFLPLDACRIILVLVTDDGVAENVVINLPDGAALEDFEHIAQIINKNLSGTPLNAIKREKLDDICRNIFDNTFLSKYLFDALSSLQLQKKTDKVFLGGTANIFNQPEFKDIGKIKEILAMLEEDGLIKDILSVGEESGMQITIGSENKFSGIQNCSMVQATYRLNGQIVGTFAVLGPTRMKYGKVISVMDYLHKYLQAILSSINDINDS